MAINRYYQQPAMASGILEFLAGFGHRRQQVKMAEAQLQAEQNQRVGQQIGQGIGNIVQVPAQDYLAGRAGQRQLANALALQNNQQAGQQALLAQRDAMDLFQQTRQQNRAAGIAPYGSVQFEPPPTIPPELEGFSAKSSAAIGDMTAEPNMTQATGPAGEGGMTPGVPLPSIDPAYTQAYQKAKSQLNALVMQREEMQADPGMSAQDKVAADQQVFIPRISALRQTMQRYPQPKQPTTYDEVVQQGGAMPIPGTMNMLLPDPKGGYKVSTAVHPATGTPAPKMATTFEGKQVPIVPGNPIQLDESTWYVEDSKGAPHFFAEKKEADGDKGGPKRSTYPQARAQALKQLNQKDADGKSIVATREEVEKLTQEILWSELTPTEQRIQSLEGGLRGLMKDFPGGPTTMPPNQQRQLQAFAAELKTLKGG